MYTACVGVFTVCNIIMKERDVYLIEVVEGQSEVRSCVRDRELQ